MMFDPHDYIAKFASKDRMPGADTPGFLDGFLYSISNSWNTINASFRKFGTEYMESHDVYTSRGYMEPEGREDSVQERLNLISTLSQTELLGNLSAEEKEAFSWVKTEGDFAAQEKALLSAREGARLNEEGDWTSIVGEFVGELVNPLTLAEFGVIGKGVGALTQFAKPVAKAFAGWANRTFGTGLKFAEIATGETAKRVLGTAGHAGAIAAVYSYLKDNERQYIGIPVENVGSDMAWNALLGACFGGVGGYLSPHLQKLLRKNREDISQSFCKKVLNDFADSEIRVEWADIVPQELDGQVDTGALSEAGNKIKQIVSIDGDTRFSKLFGYIPTVQGLKSQNPIIQKLTDAYFRHQYTTPSGSSTLSGISTPVESEMTQWMGLKYQCLANIAKHKKEFLKRGYGSKEDFNAELSHAMLNGDTSSNHIIAGCASAVRKKMRILTDEAVKYGIFEKESVAGESYLPRMYDTEKIRNDFDGWENTFREAVKKKHPEYADKQIREYFEDVTDTIRGLDVDDIPTVRAVQSKAKVTKGRKVDLESLDLFEYLVQEPERMMDVYFTGLGFEVAEKRVLGELGFESFADAYEAAKAEASKISRTMRGDARNKFEKQNEKDLELLKKIPKLITGQISSELRFNLGNSSTNRSFNKILRTLDTLNSTTLLGKVGLAAIEDLALTASERGLFRHIGELWRHKFGNALEGFSKEDLHRFGIAIESLSGNINVLSSPSHATKLSSLFWKLTGAPQIDDFRSRVIASLMSQDIAASILQGKEFSTRLNTRSLDSIRKELQNHAVIGEHGIEDINISSWESFDAKRDFMSEVERNIRTNIPVPGAGDIPLFFKSPLGKLTTMFMGWTFSLTNQIILPLMQSGKVEWARLAKLMTYGFGLSFLTNIIRGYIRGNPYDLAKSEIYKDSVLKMPLGVFGIPIEMGNQLFRGANWGKDVAYNVVKGGSLRWIWDAMDTGIATYKAEKRGRWTEKDVRRWYGITPFANLWFINPILNYFNVGEPK